MLDKIFIALLIHPDGKLEVLSASSDSLAPMKAYRENTKPGHVIYIQSPRFTELRHILAPAKPAAAPKASSVKEEAKGLFAGAVDTVKSFVK